MTDPRTAATAAATAAMDATEQNVLGRNVAWQIVNAALDAYEDEWAHALDVEVMVAYAVVSVEPNISPDILPTERMARRHLKRVAKEMGRKRSDFAVLLVNTYLSR